MTSIASNPDVRRTGIGGSDIAAIAGIDPWGRTRYDVWAEKIGRSDLVAPREFGEGVDWGNLLEDPVAQESARRLGVRIARVNKTLVHRLHPFLIGHLDRKVIGERAALEVKTTSLWMAGKWSSDSPDDIPPHIQMQVQHYAEVADLERVYVAVLIGGQMLKIFTVERDRAMGQAIIDLCVAFWNDYVVADVEPPPLTIEEVRHRFPQHVDRAIEADHAALNAFYELRNAKERKREAEAAEKAAQDNLAAFMADHDALTCAGQTLITFRTQKSARVDVTGLRAALPDVAAQFTKESTTRVMLVKKGSK